MAIKVLPDVPRATALCSSTKATTCATAKAKRYRAIRDYIEKNDSKCILLSATPYNKTYLDLSSQLRLFIQEDQDLGVRPERLLRELGETEFDRRPGGSSRR